MRRLGYTLALALVASSMLTIAGCGGSSVDTVPVTGTVLMDGKPVEGAAVAFRCEGQPKAAVGTTDAEGKFTLTLNEDGDGAMVGTHTVTVSKVVTNEKEISADEDSSAAYIEMMKDSAKDGGEGIKDNDEGHQLPVGYSRPYETDLTAEVTADGENNFELKLKKEGPSPK